MDSAPSPLPTSAKEVVERHRGKLVAFLGSGISLFAPTSLPTWWGYIKAVVAAIGGAAPVGGRDAAAAISSALDAGILPPFKVTDILARRLGAAYLDVMGSFLDVPTNTVHKWAARCLLDGTLRAVASTNFDQAVETAVEEHGGDVVRLTGDWPLDRAALEAQWERHLNSVVACSAAQAATTPVVAVPTFAAFASVGHAITMLARGSHAFILKVHGDAGTPASCIDTEFQRVQGLPSHVTDALTSLLHQCPFLFMGFSGGDLARDIDYLRLRSEGDQATVAWLLRTGEEEPAALFARMRSSLGPRFSVVRGSLEGSIEPGGIGGAVIRSRIHAWATRSVGPLWASMVLADLAATACISPSVVLPLLNAATGVDASDNKGGTLPHATDVLNALLLRVSQEVLPSADGSLVDAAVLVPDAAKYQLEVAIPLREAIAALEEVNRNSGGRASDARAIAGLSAVRLAVKAVCAQRRHFPDSRMLPDAWMPLAALAAGLDACNHVEDAGAMLNTAAAVAELAGDFNSAQELAAAAAVCCAADSSPADAAEEDKDELEADGGTLLLFLPSFDNVGGFAQQGVQMATVLRAQLHRAMMVGDAIAVGPHFLLNCRPFLAEVLAAGTATGDVAEAVAATAVESADARDLPHTLPRLMEGYLAHIRPLLPVRQTVDRGPAGKVTIELRSDPHPLLTFRRECQERNPGFLAERVDASLVAAVDAYYTASPARAERIVWFDMAAAAGSYGSRTRLLAEHAGEAALAFPEGFDREAAAECLPAAARFVGACLAPQPASSGECGSLNRSLMYRFGDLFRYPTSEVDFRKACGPQLAALDAAAGTGVAAAASSCPPLALPLSSAAADASAAAALAAPIDEATSVAASPATPSQALLLARQRLVDRPWRYGSVLRDLSDAAYITALPLSSLLGLSMVLDGAREQRLAALAACALRLEEDDQQRQAAATSGGAAASAAAAGSAVAPPAVMQVLDAVTAASGLRVTEFARLPLQAVLRLRSCPEAAAFRCSVRRLRTGQGGGGEAGAEELVRAAGRALFEAIRPHLTPVDQRPLPSLQLSLLTSVVDNAAALASRCADDAPAICPHIPGSLWRRLAAGVTVCKGSPIQPTFAIPTLDFPALVPVLRRRGGRAEAPPALTAVAAPDSGLQLLQSMKELEDQQRAAPPPIACLEHVVAYADPRNKWLSLRFDRVRFPGGVVGAHNVVTEFTRAGTEGRPGVCILPITPDGRLLLLRQFRYPVGEWSWEVPRGGPEPGCSPAEQALAELEEETGHTTANLVRLAAGPVDSAGGGGGGGVAGGGGSESHGVAPTPGYTTLGLLWPNAGISSTRVAFFAALGVTLVAGGARPEKTEVIARVQAVPARDVLAMVRAGRIADQFTVAALGLGLAHGLLPQCAADSEGGL